MAKTNKYYPVRAPAAAVKQGRNRGPTVTQRRIVEAAEADKTRAATRAARAAKAPSKAQQLLQGLLTMASATAGNVYGRVKMHSTPKTVDGSGTGQDRASSLQSKAWCRRSVHINGLGPSGNAALEELPGREAYAANDVAAAQHEADFIEYFDANIEDAAAEVRSMDYRDRKVGHFGNWLSRVGHGDFIHWVRDEATQLFRLEPIYEDVPQNHCDEESTLSAEMPPMPRVPSPVAIMEWAVKQATGHESIKKGGDAEYMNGPWYKSRGGKRIGDIYKRSAKKRSKASTKYAYVTIEQNISAVRKWYDWVLRDTKVANPARNYRLQRLQKTLAKRLTRHRQHSPAVMEREFVRACYDNMDPRDTEEVMTTFYLAKNVVKGDRAADEYLLDWSDIKWSQATASHTAGIAYAPCVSKNDREGHDKPKGLPCVTHCDWTRNADGMWQHGVLCPAHLGLLGKQLQARDAGVAVEDLKGPVFGTYRRIEELPAGATLVKCDDAVSASSKAKSLVLVVTREQEAQGIFYDRSLPFTCHGRRWRPPCMGTWFEVAGAGYAVHAWGSAQGVTYRMRRMLYKANARAGIDLVPPETIEQLSSKSCRIAMATLMDRDGIPMSEVVANGQWEDEAMARTYIRLHDALAVQQRNLCDVHWGPGHVGGAAERAQEGAAEVEISEVAPVESQSVPLLAAGLHTLGSIQQPPWESEAAMPRPAEEIAAAVMAQEAAPTVMAPAPARTPAATKRKRTEYVPCCPDKYQKGWMTAKRVNADAKLRSLMQETEGAIPSATQARLCSEGYHTTRKEIDNFRLRQAGARAAAMPPAAPGELEALLQLA